jgi:cytochrome b561
MSIGSKYGIHWFGIPFLPGIDNETLRDLFKEFHEIFGQILLLFFILHFAGALKHAFVNKDGVLKRMWFHK